MYIISYVDLTGDVTCCSASDANDIINIISEIILPNDYYLLSVYYDGDKYI